jgi:hypothetical protein
LEAGTGLNFLTKVLDDLEGRVVLHEEVEGGFILVDKTADGWGDDLS